MRYYVGTILCESNFLEHHGIKNQKWGIRRFQNEDGSLTEAGRRRYLSKDGSLSLRGNFAFFSNNGRISKKGRHILKTAGRDSDIGKAILARRAELKKEVRELKKQMKKELENENDDKYSDNNTKPEKYGEEFSDIFGDTRIDEFGDIFGDTRTDGHNNSSSMGRSFVDDSWSRWESQTRNQRMGSSGKDYDYEYEKR